MQALIKRIRPRRVRDVVDAEAAFFLGGEGARGAVGEVVGFFAGAGEAAGCAGVVVIAAVARGSGGERGVVVRGGEQEERFLEDFVVEGGCCGLRGVGAGEEGVGDVVGGLRGGGCHGVCVDVGVGVGWWLGLRWWGEVSRFVFAPLPRVDTANYCFVTMMALV